MPRPALAHWSTSRRCWLTALGEWYLDASGRRRRRQVVLCDEHGHPIARDDEPGKLRALAALRAEAESRDGNAVDPPLGTVFAAWIAWHKGRKTTASSDAYRRQRAKGVCNLVMPGGGLLGDVPIHSLRDSHYHAIRTHGERHGWSAGYVRQHCQAFLACLRWAARSIHSREPHVWLRNNPFPKDSMELPRAGQSDRPCPDWDELLAIMDRLDEYVERPNRGMRPRAAREAARVLALAVRVIAERGCRPGEVMGLKVDDWDERAGGFGFAEHKTAHRGVVGVLPLRKATADRVRALLARPDRSGPWVFGPTRTVEQGPPETQSLRLWWRRHKAGVGAEGYQLYSFRNTVSNHLRKAGVEGRLLQLALRQSTEVSGVYRRDLISDAAAVFEAAGMG
jgi:hypothetical protein